MQLSTLRTEVRDRAGVDSNDGMAADATVTRFINGAVRQVAAMKDWDWDWASETIATVVDQDAYTRAADCRKTDKVVDASTGKLLTPINPAVGVRYSSGDRKGPPRFWYVQGGSLYIVPSPDDVRNLTHYYVAAETALSGDTDEPNIPDWAIDLVIIKAALMLAARMDNTSEYNLLKDQEREAIRNMEDEARRSRGNASIESRRDWRF